MANDEMKKVGFNLHIDVIDKIEESLKIRNEQLKVTNSNINKQELIEEMINDYYFKLQGQTKDADTVNKINQFIDDGLNVRLNNLENKLDNIAYNLLRANRLIEFMMRISLGTRSERIKAKMDMDDITQKEAEEQYDEWINRIMNQPSPFVQLVDEMINDIENDDK